MTPTLIYWDGLWNSEQNWDLRSGYARGLANVIGLTSGSTSTKHWLPRLPGPPLPTRPTTSTPPRHRLIILTAQVIFQMLHKSGVRMESAILDISPTSRVGRGEGGRGLHSYYWHRGWGWGRGGGSYNLPFSFSSPPPRRYPPFTLHYLPNLLIQPHTPNLSLFTPSFWTHTLISYLSFLTLITTSPNQGYKVRRLPPRCYFP